VAAYFSAYLIIWCSLSICIQQAHAEIIAREIQQKIDGLYDLIAKGENNVKTSSWGDAFLLIPLSKRVTPRPADPDWYDIKQITTFFYSFFLSYVHIKQG
jgi:hypothetical protein